MKHVEKLEILKRVNELNIEHPKYVEFHEMLDSLRPDPDLGEYDHKPKHLSIFGESGVGKSTLVEKYTKSNPGYIFVDKEGTEYDVKPVVYAELPDPFTILEFYQTIVRALGAPQLAGARIGDVKRQAFTLLEEQRVEMLILDEVNYILGSKYVKNQEAMEAIKHVTNIGKVSVVLVGLRNSKELVNSNFQYFRRFPTLELRRFENCDTSFCDLLDSIEKKLDLPVPLGLGDLKSLLPQSLHRMSRGLMGALIPLLQLTFKKLLHNYELSEIARDNFIDMLSLAHKTILGDDEEAFTKMLETSEAKNY